MPAVANDSANELLDVVPIIMRDIRFEMRSRRSPDLTVPQFRTLGFVNRNKGSSLLEVGSFMGLTAPSASRLVDILISRGLMTRDEHPSDRRRVRLAVTRQGQAVLEKSRKETLAYLSGKLSCLASEDRDSVVKAMRTLRSVFGTEKQNPSKDR